jgi:hypothetical protein
MTDPVRPDLWSLVGAKVDLGEFDEAISLAFRHVETVIQTAAANRGIGNNLIDSAFGNSVVISRNTQDAESLKSLFKGSIGFFKGARSHGTGPVIRVVSRDQCLRIVALASVLLDLLDHSEAYRPAVDSYRQLGDSVEFQVRNVTPQTTIHVNGAARRIISRRHDFLTVEVSELSVGSHTVLLRNQDVQSPEFGFEIIEDRPTNWHRIERTDVPLFTDADGRNARTEVGVLLLSYEGGRTFRRCFPTRNSYEAGHYVAWEWDDGPGLDETWITDDSGGIVSAWTGASYFRGSSVAPAHAPQVVGIRMFPQGRSELGIGEEIPVIVEQRVSDGIGHWEERIRPPITSSDESVAHVDRHSLLRAKTLGSATIKTDVNEHFGASDIAVVSLRSGSVLKMLQSLRLANGVAYSGSHGLFITNQTSAIWHLTLAGQLEVFADIAGPFLGPSGFEKLVVTDSGRLFVRSIADRSIIEIDASHPERHRELQLADDRSPVSICAFEDEVFVTDHRWRIWQLEEEELRPYLDIPSVSGGGFTLTHLAANRETIWLLDNMTGIYAIDRTTMDVTINSHGGRQNQFSDVLLRNGSLYVSDFHAGKISILDPDGGDITDVAEGLDLPTALASGPNDVIYVANFGTGGVARVIVA